MNIIIYPKIKSNIKTKNLKNLKEVKTLKNI